MYAQYAIDRTMLSRLNEAAQQEVMRFHGREGIYNHNKVQSTLVGLMSEYAVRCLYREGNVPAHMSTTARGFRDPDIVIPQERTEEVKAWTLGYIYDKWGNTVKPSHAEHYERVGRSRIWFCEADPPRALSVFMVGRPLLRCLRATSSSLTVALAIGTTMLKCFTELARSCLGLKNTMQMRGGGEMPKADLQARLTYLVSQEGGVRAAARRSNIPYSTFRRILNDENKATKANRDKINRSFVVWLLLRLNAVKRAEKVQVLPSLMRKRLANWSLPTENRGFRLASLLALTSSIPKWVVKSATIRPMVVEEAWMKQRATC